MKTILLSLAALCCTPLFAQHPSAAESAIPTPPQHQHHVPELTLIADGSVLLCDSSITYLPDGKAQNLTIYNQDTQGRTICETTYRYHYDEEIIIWEGEQSCGGWDSFSLRFSGTEGGLPSLSDATYDRMVRQTLCVDISEVNGEGTTISVMNGWWSSTYVDDTPVHAGDTFEFEFTQQMADECKKGGEGKDLMFISNNGLTITKVYWKDTFSEPSLISKKEYTYDDNDILYNLYHHPFSEITYIWQDDTWVIREGSTKGEYTYDDNGLLTSFEFYQWSEWYGGRWIGSRKEECTYDDNGHRTSYVYYTWQDGAWVVYSKYEYTYDANGNRTSSVYYYWQNGAWVFSRKYDYTYDNNGNMTSQTDYEWRDGEWVVSSKNEYTHDAEGNQTRSVSYSWQDGAWVVSSKHEYTYDANGNETSSVYYYWQNGAWVPDGKSETTYDDHGRRTSSAQYVWWNDEWVGQFHDYVSDFFYMAGKYEYTYDDYGNQTSYAEYYWRDGAWVIGTAWKYENTYDDNGKITSSAYYTWQNGEWVLEYYDIYYYSLHTPESITQIASDTPSHAPRKQLLPDGRIVIVRDGRSYNLGGQVVK